MAENHTDHSDPDRKGPFTPKPTDPEGAERERDLGFGAMVATESRRRLLNRDGSFNVERHGLGWRSTLSLYHSLLEMTWPRFILIAFSAYLAANTLFALGYLVAGPDALEGMGAEGSAELFMQGFFFSVHTLSTVGYGHIIPISLAANLLMTVEAVVALFGLALGTGLIFARFSRPRANIVFSRTAVIAPYRDKTAFQFRIANVRRSQLLDLEAKVLLSMKEPTPKGGGKRRFYELELERRKVAFFPLSWTIVHPIDSESPLSGVTARELADSDPEVLVLLTGVEETFSQMVHARTSYKANEIVWQARFGDMFEPRSEDAPIAIDVSRIHDVEPAA